jgi:TetR/AcrR family transcriptional regulator, cholesterol catabolism regulator
MPRLSKEKDAPPAEPAVRARIVAGARRHFLAHGFRGVTMDDLAAELGMSKKTLYAHFRSKPELVQAVILAKAADVEAELGHIETECASDFAKALREMLSCLQRHAQEIQPTFVRDMRQSAPDLFKTAETRRAALIQRYFGKLFEDGRRAGMVRKDLPPQLAIEILLGAIQAIVNPPKLAELDLTPQTALPAIISAVLNGILNPAGRKNP